jgi:cis-2,3-dihydrobiphenyl-2,3-diol dehydrogenase
MGWLEGEVALITGAGSGLGRAIAERFVEEGARVAIFDRHAERAEETMQALNKQRRDSAIAVIGDVRLMADNQRAVDETFKAFGKLDVFIGNAGVWDLNAHLVDYPTGRLEAALDELFAVNIKGYLFGTRAAMPALLAGKGSIIFTISDAGFSADNGGILYTMSKHAIVGMTRQLAFELAPHIRVNGVAPGFIPTDLRGLNAMQQDHRSLAEMEKMAREVLPDHLPLMRVPEAEDYTGVYVFLASRRNARMATGAVVTVDGGQMVRGNLTGAGGKDLAHRLAGKKKESLY